MITTQPAHVEYLAVRKTQQPTTNEVVAQHTDLVKRIAHHLAVRLPTSIDVNDLIQVGMIGLIEAVRAYDASHGASFESYASIRIRGSMLDEIRRGDWVPRSVYRRVREAAEVTRSLEQRTGAAARGEDIAQAMGLSLQDYQRFLSDVARGPVLSLDENINEDGTPKITIADGQPSPARHLEQREFQRALVAAIEVLPSRERMVLSLYYEQELNLREIGLVLGVSESRVCQIHGQALVRLRARLSEWLEIGEAL